MVRGGKVGFPDDVPMIMPGVGNFSHLVKLLHGIEANAIS
jgi:hypothetical protein